MDLHKINEIYNSERKDLLQGLTPQDIPIAFILGGQPASGKSKLAKEFLNKISNKDILFVNGDIYREFHPNRQELINNPLSYSQETQIFSNVFTENLIQEAIENKYNIMVEGTMRNPKVPYNTAKMFKENSFSVEVLAIAAPAIFTELGIYNRYQEEINYQGWGRLAEIESHNSAVNGILESLDLLYTEKTVDKIHLYSYQAEEHICSYELIYNKWDYDVLPSVELAEAKISQLKNQNSIVNILNRGIDTYNQIDDSLKNEVGVLLDELENILEELQREQDRPRGRKR